MGKGGGSQLAQLKSRLKTDGITDRRQQSASSKKRRSASSSRGGTSSADEAAVRRAKLAAIASSASFNPFEEKVSKPKHEVLGRKIRGATGRPGPTKASGVKQRAEQLLPEYEARDRSGGIVDRRFGEGDTGMTPEERMLERFTKEKMRAAKGTRFSLNEEEALTHYGQTLDGLNEWDDVGEEEEGGNIDQYTTEQTHFGGFGESRPVPEDEDPDRVKSKAEVMKEVMAKSKLAKMERQKVRSADDDLRHELDAELGDIRGLLLSQPAPEPTAEEQREEKAAADARRAKFGDPNITGPNAVPLGGKTAASNAAGPALTGLGIGASGAGDSYDAIVRELAFERRAKPQDRLKTEDELAKEEAERLRAAEMARLKRMRSEGDDDGDSGDEGRGKRRRKGKGKGVKETKRVPGGDDLEDDFELDGVSAGEAYGLGKGLAMEAGLGNDEEDDEEEDDDEDASEGDDSDEEGEDMADVMDPDGGQEVFSGADEDAEALVKQLSGNKTAEKTKAESSHLPFTFPCPTTHDQFLQILEEHSIEAKEVPTVIKRIRTLHHASLAEDNKHRLQAFLGVLLDHAVYRAASSASDDHLDLVNILVRHIFALSKTYPSASAFHFVSKLALMQRNLTRGLARGALSLESRTWPGIAELSVLRIAGLIWPTSDRAHAVTTPLGLLMAQYLAHARIRSHKDIAAGLFLASLFASHERDARRLVPEALNFLHSALLVLAPLAKGAHTTMRAQAEALGIPLPDIGVAHTRHLGLARSSDGSSLPEVRVPKLADMLARSSKEEEDSAQVKVDLLGVALGLVTGFSDLYQGSTAFVELFSGFSSILASIHVAALPPILTERLQTAQAALDRRLSHARSSRRALRLQAHRAIPIASHVPLFDQQGFNPDRHRFDPDTERAQAQKLRALLKKEKKGAVRELRRDNQFLAEVKQARRTEEDAEYKKKMDRIVSGLKDERHEQKTLDREKARLKKRDGR